MPALDREEYIEQAYFFRALRERLADGQSIWTNRFGNLTAMRFAFGTPADLEKAIMAKLDPAALGLSAMPIREQALAASGQSQDFGGLFIGFSFFLIISAVLLTAMMFAFAVQQRAAEIGTLLAIGFRPRQVRRLLLAEGGVARDAGFGTRTFRRRLLCEGDALGPDHRLA